MSSDRCQVCGSKTVAGMECCSTGCDLARRLPVGATNLPATWQLGVLLGWCFLLFNQLLFTVIEWIFAGRDEPAKAAGFGLAAIGAGAIVLFANAFLFAIARPKRMTDHGVAACLVLSLACAQLVAPEFAKAQFNLLFFCFNFLSALWLSRGLWRIRASKNREKR